jgi:hypothetical protein
VNTLHEHKTSTSLGEDGLHGLRYNKRYITPCSVHLFLFSWPHRNHSVSQPPNFPTFLHSQSVHQYRMLRRLTDIPMQELIQMAPGTIHPAPGRIVRDRANLKAPERVGFLKLPVITRNCTSCTQYSPEYAPGRKRAPKAAVIHRHPQHL